MGVETWANSRQWHLVYTNLKQEERANENLRAWGVETVHAKLRTRRYNEFTGAPTYITQPLFPRYLFVKFNAREQLSRSVSLAEFKMSYVSARASRRLTRRSSTLFVSALTRMVLSKPITS